VASPASSGVPATIAASVAFIAAAAALLDARVSLGFGFGFGLGLGDAAPLAPPPPPPPPPLFFDAPLVLDALGPPPPVPIVASLASFARAAARLPRADTDICAVTAALASSA
jgi:hypothetical protein